MRLRAQLAAVFVALGLAPSPVTAQLFLSSDELSATVTEWGAGEPIPDVAVIVYWKLQRGKIHGTDYEVLHRAETTTDSKGVFRIEAWGPKYGGLFWRMSGDSPYAFLLKVGYKFEVVSNFSWAFGGFRCASSKIAEMSSGIPTHSRSKIVASWNGCPIRLSRPTETPDQYAERLAWVRRELCGDGKAMECSEPLKRYFDQERRRLLALGAKRHHFQSDAVERR